MNFYAGSQPRSFISCRLGEDSNGQPTQSTEEKMDTGHFNMDVQIIPVLCQRILSKFSRLLLASSPDPEEAVDSAPHMDTNTPKSLHEPLPEQGTDATSKSSK